MDIGATAVAPIPEAALAQCLRELPDAVVLRNEAELFENLRRGGDVDLLVADLPAAERVLIRHLGAPVQLARRSYAVGYSYEWGHIDLLPTIEWRGACYLATGKVLASRRTSAQGRSVPGLAYQAAIAWLSNLLFGRFFKERYTITIHEAVALDGAALRAILLEAAGDTLGTNLWQAAVDGRPEVSAEWSRTLRRVVWWRAWLAAPRRTSLRYLAYLRAEFRLRFSPPVPWVAVLGSDGSGKSTVVNALAQRFAGCPYANVRTFHWRPRVVARSHGAEPVSDPHGRPSRGVLGSALRLMVLATDWILGYWGQLVHLRAKGSILVFDRMYFDLVVDPKRYRYGGGPRLARALWRILPKPDLVFFLDVPADVILHRKQEVARPEIERQRGAYMAVTRQHARGHVLDGTRPVAAVVDEMQRVMRAWMVEHSIASLTGLHGRAVMARVTADGPGTAPLLAGRGDRSS
jgi:thymidylate kinase